MNKLKVILKLLVSKEYYFISVEREGPIIAEEVYSSLRSTETTYKKLIRILKDELNEIRRCKHEQGGFD